MSLAGLILLVLAFALVSRVGYFESSRQPLQFGIALCILFLLIYALFGVPARLGA